MDFDPKRPPDHYLRQKMLHDFGIKSFVFVFADANILHFYDHLVANGYLGGQGAEQDLRTMLKARKATKGAFVKDADDIVILIYGDYSHFIASYKMHPDPVMNDQKVRQFIQGVDGRHPLTLFEDTSSFRKDSVKRHLEHIFNLQIEDDRCRSIVFIGATWEAFAPMVEKMPESRRDQVVDLIDATTCPEVFWDDKLKDEGERKSREYNASRKASRVLGILERFKGPKHPEDPWYKAWQQSTHKYVRTAESTRDKLPADEERTQAYADWIGPDPFRNSAFEVKKQQVRDSPSEAAGPGMEQTEIGSKGQDISQAGGSSKGKRSSRTMAEPDGVPRNKAGQRVDPDIPFKADIRYKLQKKRLCNNYHLLQFCSFGNNCRHWHGEKLNQDELAALRALARGSPCRYGSACFDKDCYAGHRCPFNPCRPNDTSCPFDDSMHFDDIQVVTYGNNPRQQHAGCSSLRPLPFSKGQD